MIDRNTVDRLFNFLKTLFEKGMEQERKKLEGKSSSDLVETMRQTTGIIDVAEGIKGARGIENNARMIREAVRQELER